MLDCNFLEYRLVISRLWKVKVLPPLTSLQNIHTLKSYVIVPTHQESLLICIREVLELTYK